MAGMISMVRMHLYQRQIVRMMCPQRQTLMARNQRNLNPESLITLRKTETLVGTPTPKTIYHGPSRKGRTYNKHTVGTPIIHKCDLSHLPEYFQH